MRGPVDTDLSVSVGYSIYWIASHRLRGSVRSTRPVSCRRRVS